MKILKPPYGTAKGVFLFWETLKAVKLHFPIDKALSEITPTYKVAPTQEILTIFRQEGLNVLEKLYWGLVPRWTKDKKA